MGGVGVASAGRSCYNSLLPHHHPTSSSSTTCTAHGTALTCHIARRPPCLLLLSIIRPPSLDHSPRPRRLLSTTAFTAHPHTSPPADDDDDEAAFDSLNGQKPPDIPPDSTTSTSSSTNAHITSSSFDLSTSVPFVLPHHQSEPYNNPGGGDVTASVELKANSVDHLPLSLRMIKRKKQQQLLLLGNYSCTACSVKRAFSSMVFIIRELQSYTLQLLRENLREGILARVQGEMHASFVWLFQHIFACTPTLMLSLMLLLANFTAHSMAHAAIPPPVIATVSAAPTDDNLHHHSRFVGSNIVKTSAGRTASIGGGGDGGRKARPVAGATDDDGRPIFDLPKGMTTTDDAGKMVVVATEEARLWNEIVEEARMMQAVWRDDALMKPEILQRLVSPVTVKMEEEEGSAYVKTELMYHQTLSEEPHSALLLTNFAQFLYLVLHDHDRAEVYFKRAVRTMPVDAEALSWYASFLWGARRDLGAAEEAYLEAIAADPGNAYHAANYANFLWSTGGEDTCYPLADASGGGGHA